MKIRAENPSDLVSVRQVHTDAFPGPIEAILVDRLRAAGKAVISLVAELDDGQIVGHILFSPVSTDPPISSHGLGLAPLAVRRDYQHTGVGSKLCRAGLEAARDFGADYVVVLGNPAYYSRFGFETAANQRLGNEYKVLEDFMVIELIPGCLKNVAVVVKYAAEFGELDA